MSTEDPEKKVEHLLSMSLIATMEASKAAHKWADDMLLEHKMNPGSKVNTDDARIVDIYNIGLTPRLRQPSTCILDGVRIADRLVCDYWKPIEVKEEGDSKNGSRIAES